MYCKVLNCVQNTDMQCQAPWMSRSTPMGAAPKGRKTPTVARTAEETCAGVVSLEATGFDSRPAQSLLIGGLK